MTRSSMWLSALLVLASAGTAAAADARQPTTYDELRALAGERQDGASPAAPVAGCDRMPTSSDEARAVAGARLPTAVASREAGRVPAARTPSTTDEARALVASATNARVASIAQARHADACARACACKHEMQAPRTAGPCACQKRT